jgi:alpha-beta hydrolase superfamily lysophospholipase
VRKIHAESVVFPSESGSVIRGWVSRGAPHGGAVLLLPGIRANRLSMVGRAQVLLAAGYSTLSIDFQATGESPGDIITFGWRERLDVLAAVETLRQTLPGEPIGIIGMSLGGAATVLAAPALDVQAVVLEAVYPSIDVAVENRLRMRLGTLGAALSPLLLLQLRPRLGISSSDLKPVDRIALLRCPILVIGGTDDQHTTVADTQQLYEAAHQPKELWLIPNTAHVDYLRAGGEDYRRRVLAFLDRTLRIARPG